MKDSRTQGRILEDSIRAAVYSEAGSLKRGLLRLGFFPDSDDVAFDMLSSIVRENEEMRARIEELDGQDDLAGEQAISGQGQPR